MAAYNASAADVLRNATLAADHFERTSATTTFLVPTSTPTLQLEPFSGVANNSHFGTSGASTSHHQINSHQTNSTSSSYTFVQIKREPCQVSEVTTSNNCHHQQLTTTQQQQQHSSSMSSSSKTTLTTLVKIEASSPKVQELDKSSLQSAPMANTNNSVPVGIAVARKRPQESTTTMGSASIPVQQTLNKDLNCFGIRVADIGGVSSGCGNFYFTGNGDLMTGSTHGDELALSAAGVQSVNRAPSTFWQYPTVPIESVISMSPATVGLQYQRDANRGQVVLLPATAAALDPFQQAAAAAFVWPSYIPQGTTAAALQPPPNFIFPSMSPHSSLQAPSYATPLQLFGSNYLTAAAAAAAAAAATSTFCQQHNQQQTNSSSSSSTSAINFGPGGGNNSCATSSSSSRYLSVGASDSKRMQDTLLPKQQQQLLPLVLPPPTMKIEEWSGATEYMTTAAAKTTTTTLSATTQQNHHHIGPPTTTLSFDRDKTTSNLLELHGGGNSQALNLMRLPTPPTSASIEATSAHMHPQILFQTSATSPPTLLNLSASNTSILPRAGSTAPAGMNTNFLNSVNNAATLTATIGGPPTPLCDEALNFKTTTAQDAAQQQFVVGVPRQMANSVATGPAPQMQDVNIQTDTPVCSEDESSSCPHAIQSNIPASGSVASTTPPPSELDAHEAELQQPLELTTTGNASANLDKEQQDFTSDTAAASQCHKNESVGKEDSILGYVQQNNGDYSNQQTLYTVTQQVEQSSEIAAEQAGEINTTEQVNVTNNQQTAPEDLTGLELLSNISTSSFAQKNTPLRVKLEPVDQAEYIPYAGNEQLMQQPITNPMQQESLEHNYQNNLVDNTKQLCLQASQANNVVLLPQTPLAEPLGGLSLLCALAEQRIQEEVQCSGSIFNADANINNQDEHLIFHHQQPRSPPGFALDHPNAQLVDSIDKKPTQAEQNDSQKRKKHKHSKSSKSGRKSSAQRCAKKNKKKCAKEKHKNKQSAPKEREMEFEDEEDLQEDFKSAFDKVDSSYKCFGKWPNREEIFKAMESDMRLRLAEITRQYRKKKRKLDEISKNKKHKKKALKKSALNAIGLGSSGHGTSSLACLGSMNIAASTSSNTTNTISSSPMCDYKFSKLLTKSSTTHTTGSYLSPSNFLRFSDNKLQLQSQFPPAVDMDQNLSDPTPSCSSSISLYKPLRLEPSALTAAVDGCGRSTPMRTQKHAATEKCSQLMPTPCKERKLTAAQLSSDIETVRAGTSKKRSLLQSSSNSIDRELALTSEHLYRKETRVLTDMGGLFYAGIMKPLQPPDVYAITLDGERGNKSHIMSREEIFKDTILEVSPNSIESVPVGTRLCAYWSQQYRCLYPGRAIESEPPDDGTKNDFVSVEFDDGDSGRIRLQNIRFLLSDYPIVEYDNPLYSLGKQKRSVIKSGNNSEHTQHQESSSADDQLQQLQMTTHHSTAMQQKSMEIFAHRSEKKRIKSLKKKKALASNSCVGGSSSITIDANERMRKHHKHKKRKKHKKHHHRKALAADAEGNTSCVDVGAATNVFPNNKHALKQRSALAEDTNFMAEEDEETADHEQNGVNSAEFRLDKNVTTIARGADNFKLESMSLMSAAAEGAATTEEAVKVKTENLDLEEETTSNMMSEISDEAKLEDDEIEHNNSKGSKIAAFLPERQLWGWLGKAYRKAGVKGRARKQFYKTIKRGKETITVGDCAVFLSTGRPDRPYIGRIESMWETASSNKVVRVRWFYHPEETTGCPVLKYPGALFESPHEDENDVQTISHRCEVLPFTRYFDKFGTDSKQYQSIYDNNDTYYLSGYYNPKLQVLKLQDDIPTLEEKNTTDE